MLLDVWILIMKLSQYLMALLNCLLKECKHINQLISNWNLICLTIFKKMKVIISLNLLAKCCLILQRLIREYGKDYSLKRKKNRYGGKWRLYIKKIWRDSVKLKKGRKIFKLKEIEIKNYKSKNKSKKKMKEELLGKLKHKNIRLMCNRKKNI